MLFKKLLALSAVGIFTLGLTACAPEVGSEACGEPTNMNGIF